MRAHGYVNGVPRRDPKIAQDLIAQIKRRGVVSRLEAGKDDLQCFAENLANYGVNDVVKASSCNLGTPTTLSWLSGRWILYVIGGVVDTAPGDGYIHRRNESIGKLGFLSISLKGTYTWKLSPSDPPAKYVKGSWRKATSEEIERLRGQPGITLRPGDVITQLEGQPVVNQKNYVKMMFDAEKIGDHPRITGEPIRVTYRRGTQSFTDILPLNSGGADIGQLIYPASYRSTGFASALSTDLPVRPEHCGAPVVDSEGHVLGILIARTRYVETLVLPAREVLASLETMKASLSK